MGFDRALNDLGRERERYFAGGGGTHLRQIEQLLSYGNTSYQGSRDQAPVPTGNTDPMLWRTILMLKEAKERQRRLRQQGEASREPAKKNLEEHRKKKAAIKAQEKEEKDKEKAAEKERKRKEKEEQKRAKRQLKEAKQLEKEKEKESKRTF